MNARQLSHSLLLALGCALLAPAWAQSDEAQKLAAAERYLRAVPMSQMLDDSYAQIAKGLPADQRARFLADMRAVVRVDRLEQIAKASMAKTFSLEEINALADFYASPHGKSAMAKFGVYMSDIMPALMQEMERSLQELRSRGAPVVPG
jgi:hypothetical protein